MVGIIGNCETCKELVKITDNWIQKLKRKDTPDLFNTYHSQCLEDGKILEEVKGLKILRQIRALSEIALSEEYERPPKEKVRKPVWVQKPVITKPKPQPKPEPAPVPKPRNEFLMERMTLMIKEYQDKQVQKNKKY